MAEAGTLSGLVARLEEGARERQAALEALGFGVADYPQLGAVQDFRRLHARVRSRAQLRETLRPPPADAGPLNSASLAHRALALMRETSPGYLQHFMAYLDALSWLEQLQAGPPAQRRAPRRASTRKSKRGR